MTRGYDRQRPHMLFDNIQLQRVDPKAFLSIPCGNTGMVKAVPAPMTGVVPVVKIKIMQQSSANQRALLSMKAKKTIKLIAIPSDSKAMG